MFSCEIVIRNITAVTLIRDKTKARIVNPLFKVKLLALVEQFAALLKREFLNAFFGGISRPTVLPSCCYTAQKMKFSIKDFFSECDQIRSKLRIWSHLLEKSLLEKLLFCALVVLHPSKISGNVTVLGILHFLQF